MTTKARKTPAQRKAEAEAIHAKMAEQVEALRSSDEWMRFLTFAARFHHYSVNNCLLILAQCENATQVAGFRTWLAGGRAVRKGEKAIRILAPMKVKTTETDPATGEEAEGKRVFFKPVPVFDISQTDPIDGADDLASGFHGRINAEDPTGIYDRTAAHLTGIGWTVERHQLHDARDGYSTNDGTHRVVVDADLSPADAAAVILHEAAHITLGHCDKPGSDYAAHRGADETAAESVAYVLGNLLGLDTTAASIGYLAGWADGPDGADAIKKTAADVLAAVHTLAAALIDEPDTEQQEHPAA